MRSSFYLLLPALLSPACRSASHAPAVPTSGIERPHSGLNATISDSDQDGPRVYVEELVASLLERIDDPHARIAVFPALTGSGVLQTSNGLGTRLADDIAEGLEFGGQDAVFHGKRLQAELELWNRSALLLCDSDAGLAIAEWMEFDYVITGVTKISGSHLEGGRSLTVDLQCFDLRSNAPVASFSHVYARGPLAVDLTQAFREPGGWPVCDPGAFQGSLDIEIQLAAAKLANRLMVRFADNLTDPQGQTLTLRSLPTILPGTGSNAGALTDFSLEYQRRLGEAYGRYVEAVNPIESAMAEPTRIMGKGYESFHDAAAELRRLRRDFENTDAGRLATLFSDKLAEGVKANGAVPIEMVAADSNLNAALVVVMAEAERAREGSIDPESLDEIEFNGTGLLLQSEIRKNLDGKYEIVVQLMRLSGKTVPIEENLPLYEYYAREVDALLSR